ncbi:MAG: sulfotransferase domain-containing protein [Alphaproteobacteria bacterium]|jgi:hypothetical protein|nr:sulfotransferase domain-containing protein [Alphaproteobacteria bacterium]
MGAIIWLASYPKSGNTWIRAFLHNLLRNPDRPADINTLDSFTLGDAQGAWFEIVSGRPWGDLSDEEIAKLRPRVHERMTRSFPDSVFVKTHCVLGEFKEVPQITMEHTGGAIYILRSPFDVAISMSHQFGLDIDNAISWMADPDFVAARDPETGLVPHAINSWSNHVKSWTRVEHDTLHVVRYEDLHQHPAKFFRGIAEFLGLQPPRERLKRAIRHSSFKVLRGQEDKHGFVERSVHAERFFRQGKMGVWRKILTPGQVERVVKAHGEQMERFGYLP